MALGTLICGRYSGTFNSVDTGITQNGYELTQDSKAEEVTPTDAYGDSIIDLCYRGGNVYIQFEGKEYKAGAITPFWPWGTLGLMGIIGRLASDVAAAMVLTSTAGTPAASAPATITASKSILAPNNSSRLLYDSKVRNVPIRLLVLPFSNSGTITWFTQT